MVKQRPQDIAKEPAKQADSERPPQPNEIGAGTPYDFDSKNLTAYGGLLPVATLLERLRFRELVEDTVTVKRLPRAMSAYHFLLGMMLACYIGFSRLNHLRFLEREPMLTGILKVLRLPGQSTFWRFLASLHLTVAAQLLKVQRVMRARVWAAAHVELTAVSLDTDTTVHTLFGQQMGARKGYNPQHRGKPSYQPILTFLAETREYAGGELRKGDRPTGRQIAQHLESVITALPASVKTVYARADSGFYCGEAIEAYRRHGCQFMIAARKTARLVEQLEAARWTGSPRTDADGQCEFRYQPEGWVEPLRFIALRYFKPPKAAEPGQPEQYQLFDTPAYTYRVFVTNMKAPIDALVGFYRQRGSAENLIKEANNDAGLAAHPSARWAMNCVHFQIAMLAYNLNCWLLLFNRDDHATLSELPHTTLATTRLRFLFLAAKIWRHAGRVGVSYSDHYAEQGLFRRLMDRLRSLSVDHTPVAVIPTPLRN